MKGLKVKISVQNIFISFIVYSFNHNYTITYKASTVFKFLDTKSLALLLYYLFR
jgi:hypothetical protein